MAIFDKVDYIEIEPTLCDLGTATASNLQTLINTWATVHFHPNITGAILEIGLRVGVIPFNVTSGHILLTIFVSFHSLRGQKPLQGALFDLYCTKLRLIHHVK